MKAKRIKGERRDFVGVQVEMTSNETGVKTLVVVDNLNEAIRKYPNFKNFKLVKEVSRT